MRTLNKALCLVLAVVMVVGMCAFSVSAEDNLAEFTDGKDISSTYKEAVDLLVGVKVVEGMGDGTINLTGKYTRAQAATIVARIKLGTTGANNLKCVTAPFTDVGVDHWAAGAIAYCAQAGILDGLGDGSFDPEGTLTGYAFGKMLLCAVGYGQNGEYVGTGWEINVAKDGVKRKVYDTNDLGAATNDVITRQQAMLMAFNTLTKVNVVKFSTLINDYVNVNASQNQIVTGGSVDQDYLLTDNFSGIKLATGPVEWSNSLKSYVVTNGYNYFTEKHGYVMDEDNYKTKYMEKKYVEVPVTASFNDVGRIFSVWYDNKTNGTQAKAVSTQYAADTLLFESHDGTDFKALTNETNTKFKVKLDDVYESYVNGDDAYGIYNDTQVSNLSQKLGVSVSFYDWNKDNKADVISVVERRVAKLTAAPSVSTDGKKVTINSSTTEISGQRDIDKITGYEGLAKGDYVLYVIDAAKVLHLEKPEAVTGSVRRTNGKDQNGSAVLYIGDDSYKIGGLTGIDSDLALQIIDEKGGQCRFYKDSYGNIVAYEALTTGSSDYVVLLDLYYNVPTVSLANQDIDLYAKVLQADGTVKDVKLVKMSYAYTTVNGVKYKADYYDSMKVKRYDDIYQISYKYKDLSGATVEGHDPLDETWTNLFYYFYELSPSGSGYELKFNGNQDRQKFITDNTNDPVVQNSKSDITLYDDIDKTVSTRYANNNTIYLYYTGSAYKAVTGVANAPTSRLGENKEMYITTMGSMNNTGNVEKLDEQEAKMVFISSGGVYDSGNKYFIYSSRPVAQVTNDASTANVDESGYIYKVLKNGTMEEMTFTSQLGLNAELGWYELTFGGDNERPSNYVTEAKLINGKGVNSAGFYGIATSGNGVVTLGSVPAKVAVKTSVDYTTLEINNKPYSYTNDVKVYVIDTDGNLQSGGSELLATDINDLVYVVAEAETGAKKAQAKEVYVVKVADPTISSVTATILQNLVIELEFDENDMSWLSYADAGITNVSPKYAITLRVNEYTSVGTSLVSLIDTAKIDPDTNNFIFTIKLDGATVKKLTDDEKKTGFYGFDNTVGPNESYYVSVTFKDMTTGAEWTVSTTATSK